MTAGEVEGEGVKAVTDPTADLDQTQPKGRKLQMGDMQRPPSEVRCGPSNAVDSRVVERRKSIEWDTRHL